MPTDASDTLKRVVELWPSLPESARQTIVDIAENVSRREAELELTPEEERLIEQSLEDFKHGRALDLDAYRAEMDAFMRKLMADTKP